MFYLLAIPVTIACFCIMFATSNAYGCSIMNVILLFIFVIVCCIFWSIPCVYRSYCCVVLLRVLRLFCVSLSSVCCMFHACRVCSDIVSAFFCISIRAGFDMSLFDFLTILCCFFVRPSNERLKFAVILMFVRVGGLCKGTWKSRLIPVWNFSSDIRINARIMVTQVSRQNKSET